MKLNTEQLMQIFDVSYMTVYNWRHPKLNSDKTVLTCHSEKVGTQRHKIYFVWSEVKQWAKKNGVLVVKQPNDLI